MDAGEQSPAILNLTQQIENATALDGPVHAFEPAVRAVFGSGRRAGVLRGEWLGHSLHPPLTDLVLGSWTSATLLDLVGGREAAPAAKRLVATGLLAFGPTAWSGWADWLGTDTRGKRVGLVHALTQGAAAGAYAASWSARRRGKHGSGVGFALLGAALGTAGGYLGGHLASPRSADNEQPAYDATASSA